MGKLKGFTLIELVIVIIILAILASTALPKFTSLTSDANASVVEQLGSSVQNTVDHIYLAGHIPGHSDGDLPSKVEKVEWQVKGMGKVFTNFGYLWPNWLMANKITFDHLSMDKMPGTNSDAVSSNYDLVCEEVDFCVQLNVTNDFKPTYRPPASTSYWGVYYVPDGYSINDKCYAFYGLDIISEFDSKRESVFASETSGC